MVRRRAAAPAEGGSTSRVSFSNKALRNEDETCKVRVYLTGMDSATGKPLPNNITKTLFINDISVSEAGDAIAAAFK